MPDCEPHDLRDEVESLIGWWRDAGVDTLIDEQPRDWLADGGVKEARPKAEPQTARSDDSRATVPVVAAARSLPVFPATLPELLGWMATDTQFLADYPVRQRLAPEGSPSSTAMIVTDVPERGDGEAGQLLSGEIGTLFDRMIAAWKIDRSQVYLTALAPARPASGRLDAAALDLLGPMLMHHIRLAAPKKLWLLGEAASRAVLGLNVAEATGRLHFVNYDGTSVETIATLHPRVLLREPKSKGRVWEDMQRLIGNGTA